MPQAAWSAKRERQYAHIRDSAKKRGASTDRAEEITARTVNKERAQHGEAKHARPQTVHDTPDPCAAGAFRTPARRAARASSCTRKRAARVLPGARR